MNIAVGGLLILLLILPGMFFRSFVIKSESFENPLDTSFKAEVSLVFLYAILCNYVGLLITNMAPSISFSFKEFYLLVVGDSKNNDFALLQNSISPFFLYLILQIIIAGFVGFFIKNLTLHYNWDLKNIIPISNEWDNLLAGRLFLFKRNKKLKKAKKELIAIKNDNSLDEAETNHYDALLKKIENKIKQEIDYTQVTALIELNNTAVTYRGYLYKYYLASNNSLDKIVLTNTIKEGLSGSDTIELESSEDNLFVIPYSNILNLDIKFKFFEQPS